MASILRVVVICWLFLPFINASDVATERCLTSCETTGPNPSNWIHVHWRDVFNKCTTPCCL
ncbi:uncharacterized protein BCR38DRAFT_432752, partial [Pseudomassariella vexata]